MLTLDQLKAMAPDTVFATGTVENSPEGVYMESKYPGRLLRWVAVRGGIHDWCIVCHWADEHDAEFVKQQGDKIMNKNHIQKLVPCTQEALKYYRY